MTGTGGGAWLRLYSGDLNVKWFGATGSNSGNDSPAINNAITVATTTATWSRYGQGAVVFFPPGVYLCAATITMAPGVSLRGSGRLSSAIKFNMSTSDDGLYWYASSVSFSMTAGFVRDLTVIAATTTAARDLLSITNWNGALKISDCDIVNAGHYGINLINSTDTSVEDCQVTQSVSAAVFVGNDPGTISTTTRFVRCYLNATTEGPGADVQGDSITFDSCVFESNGLEDNQGSGIRVRFGRVTMTGCYFENNAGHDMWLGSDDHATVTVINPLVHVNGSVKATGYYGLYAQKVWGGGLFGGDFSGVSPNIVIDSTSANFAVVNPRIVATPTYLGGAWTDYPGFVSYSSLSTSDIVVGTNYLTVNQTATIEHLVLDGSAVTTTSGQLALGSGVSGSASTGSSGAPPAQVAGYLIGNLGGTAIKIPYYNA